MERKINKITLDNGLRVVHLADAGTRMVTVNILYGVGARDEQPARTGLAHLLEHLMFEGSQNVPSYDNCLQQAGGENNAYTNNDYTNYYLTLPVQNIETAFWLESDRMANLTLTGEKLSIQRQVVMEEFKQSCLNQPYGDVSALMRAMAYKKHPYRWSTIGKRLSHIAGVSLGEVEELYHRYYSPANAVLSVVGNVEWSVVIELARKWFGNIPHGEPVVHRLPQEPLQRSVRRKTVTRDVPSDALYISFHMCDKLNPRFEVFDLISDVLSNGYSGRLTQRLTKKRTLFHSIDAYISGSVDEGLLNIMGHVSPKYSLEQAEQAVWAELKELRSKPLTRAELEKVKNRFEAERVFERMDNQSMAANLAYYEWIDRAEAFFEEVPRYRAVTADQVMETAQRWLVPANSCVMYYKRKSS